MQVLILERARKNQEQMIDLNVSRNIRKTSRARIPAVDPPARCME